MTTHFAKKNEQRAGGERVRGSSSIVADASSVLTLEPATDNRLKLTFTKIKDGPSLEPQVLRVDWTSGLVTTTDEHPAVLDNRIDAVVTALAPSPLTHTALVKAVMSALGIGKTTAKELVSGAYSAGRIVKVGTTYEPAHAESHVAGDDDDGEEHDHKVTGSIWVAMAN
jgi:hypothetical protein